MFWTLILLYNSLVICGSTLLCVDKSTTWTTCASPIPEYHKTGAVDVMLTETGTGNTPELNASELIMFRGEQNSAIKPRGDPGERTGS